VVMLRSPWWVVIVVNMVGCGPTFVSPAPVEKRTTLEGNRTWFWQVKSSSLAFGDCSDAEDFRVGVEALPFSDNSFIIYKTDEKATTAVTQTCTALAVNTCSNSSSGIAFKVMGSELTSTRPATSEVLNVRDQLGMTRKSSCSLRQDEEWTFRDQGSTFQLEVKNTLSLVDEPAATPECELFEQSLSKRSPNGKGVRGCVITFTLQGELR